MFSGGQFCREAGLFFVCRNVAGCCHEKQCCLFGGTLACDLKTNANDNTQRIIDTMNAHWQSDLQQRYNDARLELSQQRQNATLIAALGTKTPTATT